MIKGKISESILNRSVFKLIRHRRKDVYKKPSVEDDCSLIKMGEDYVCISTNPVTLSIDELGKKGIYHVANNIACVGGELIGVLVNILLPPMSNEKDIKLIMNDLENECQVLNIEVMGGHTEMIEGVIKPMITFTGVGKIKNSEMLKVKDVAPGNDIVMTKWAGMEGAAILARKGREELLGKYKSELVDKAENLSNYISVLKEASIAKENGALYMHDATSSGVYGALWELSCGIKHGIEIDLQQIPIKQEIVEVCEFYDINPYLLASRGVLLIVVENGLKLVEELNKANIDAAVIGKVCDHNNKIIRNEDEMRYLDPPKPLTCNL